MPCAIWLMMLLLLIFQEPCGSASSSIPTATRATSCSGAKCWNAGPKWTSVLQRTPILGMCCFQIHPPSLSRLLYLWRVGFFSFHHKLPFSYLLVGFFVSLDERKIQFFNLVGCTDRKRHRVRRVTDCGPGGRFKGTIRPAQRVPTTTTKHLGNVSSDYFHF